MVFNVQDVWPDCLVIIDKLRSPLLIRIFKYLEKFIYRVSSRVTALSEGMKENLTRKGVPAEKVVVIPNWSDVETIRPVERENSSGGSGVERRIRRDVRGQPGLYRHAR